MAAQGEMPSRHRVYFALYAAAFFGAGYLYLWLRVNPCLTCHRQNVVFCTDGEFFREFLGEPGGLVGYVARFLTAVCYKGPLGAAVLVGLAALAVLGTYLLLRKAGAARPGWLSLVPAALLLALGSRYEEPLTTSVGLVAALGFASAYAYLPVARSWGRLAAFLVLGAALYWAAAGPFLLYAALAALLEAFTPRRRLLGAACALCGAAVPCVLGTLVFGRGAAAAYTDLVPFSDGGFVLVVSIALWAFFPMALACAAVWRWRAGAAAGAQPERQRGGRRTFLARLREGPLPRLAGPAAVIVLAAGLAHLAFDAEARALLAIDYCAEHEMWEDVLREARKPRCLNSYAANDVMRALYRMGRLPHEMFSYPQAAKIPAPPPSMAPFYRYRHYLKVGAVLLEIGRVNTSEHMTYEALELVGETPAILCRLARIHVLKGEVDAARVFLGRLERTLWHRDWARRAKASLAAQGDLPFDGFVRAVRPFVMRTGGVDEAEPTEMFEQALAENPRNRAAFELLMAHLLLAARSDLVVREIHRLDDFDYPEIPVHYEEAILQYASAARQPIPDLRGRRIRPQTLQRFRDFLAILNRHRDDPRAAWNALKDDYGTTYWFYRTFGRTPFGWDHPGPPPGEGKTK